MEFEATPAPMSKSQKKRMNKRRRQAEETAAAMSAAPAGEPSAPLPNGNRQQKSRAARKTPVAKDSHPREPSTPTRKPKRKSGKQKNKKNKVPRSQARETWEPDPAPERSDSAHPPREHENARYAAYEVGPIQTVAAFNNLSLFTAWHQTMLNAWYHGTPLSQHEACNIATQMISYKDFPSMPHLFLARARLALAAYHIAEHETDYWDDLFCGAMKNLERAALAVEARHAKAHGPHWDAWRDAAFDEIRAVMAIVDAVWNRYDELSGFTVGIWGPGATTTTAGWGLPSTETDAVREQTIQGESEHRGDPMQTLSRRRGLHAMLCENWPEYSIAPEEGQLAVENKAWKITSKLTHENQGTILKRIDAAEPSKHDSYGDIRFPHEEPEVSAALSKDFQHVAAEMDSCAVEDGEAEEEALGPFVYRTRRMTIG